MQIRNLRGAVRPQHLLDFTKPVQWHFFQTSQRPVFFPVPSHSLLTAPRAAQDVGISPAERRRPKVSGSSWNGCDIESHLQKSRKRFTALSLNPSKTRQEALGHMKLQASHTQSHRNSQGGAPASDVQGRIEEGAKKGCNNQIGKNCRRLDKSAVTEQEMPS